MLSTLQYACFSPRTPCNKRNNVAIVFLEPFSDPVALEGLSMWDFTWVSPRMDPELWPENGHNRVYGLSAPTWGNDLLWTRTSLSSQIPASLQSLSPRDPSSWSALLFVSCEKINYGRAGYTNAVGRSLAIFTSMNHTTSHFITKCLSRVSALSSPTTPPTDTHEKPETQKGAVTLTQLYSWEVDQPVLHPVVSHHP